MTDAVCDIDLEKRLLKNRAQQGLTARMSQNNSQLIYLTKEGNDLKEQLYPWVTEVY